MPTRKLLHELTTNTKEHAVSKLLLAILEKRGPRATRSSFALFVNSVLDLCGFPAQFGFLHVQLTGVGVETPEDYKSFVRAIVCD